MYTQNIKYKFRVRVKWYCCVDENFRSLLEWPHEVKPWFHSCRVVTLDAKVALFQLLVYPHEVEQWFHSWYRGTLDAKYNLHEVFFYLKVSDDIRGEGEGDGGPVPPATRFLLLHFPLLFQFIQLGFFSGLCCLIFLLGRALFIMKRTVIQSCDRIREQGEFG